MVLKKLKKNIKNDKIIDSLNESHKMIKCNMNWLENAIKSTLMQVWKFPWIFVFI